MAIAVDEATWPAFLAYAGAHGLDLSAPGFGSHAGRKAAEDALDAAVGSWTAGQDAHALSAALQEAGVASFLLAAGEDLVSDLQLAHRQHYLQFQHPEAGMRRWERHAFLLSETPGWPRRAPLLGEDNDWVFGSVLGLAEEELAAAYVEGIID